MASPRNAGITVGELRRQLEAFPDDAELYIGDLVFYRLKRRGDNLVQVEFNQTIYRDSSGRWVVDDHVE